MEASDQAKEPEEHAPEGDVPTVEGDQGEWLEQDPANVGVQPDGSVRMSAPPPHAQSGVPLSAEREAGVPAGEKGPVTPEPGAPGEAAA